VHGPTRCVPGAGVYDTEGSLVSRIRGEARPFHPFLRFSGMLGMKVIMPRPRDPETRVVVEGTNSYLETDFLPGRTSSPRTSTPTYRVARASERTRGPAPRSNFVRSKGSTKDRASMMSSAPLLPDVAWHHSRRLGWDHYLPVRLLAAPRSRRTTRRGGGRQVDVVVT
jgi:hypothetical protein